MWLQDDGKPAKGLKVLAGGKGFVKDGVEYRCGAAQPFLHCRLQLGRALGLGPRSL